MTSRNHARYMHPKFSEAFEEWIKSHDLDLNRIFPQLGTVSIDE